MDKKLTIGLAVNPAVPDSELPINEEYSSENTIQSITTALEYDGNRIVHINADLGVFEKLSKLKNELDIVFNISEGVPEMSSRKTAVAGMLDHFGIPYTGSDVHALTVGNDKTLARSVLNEKVINPRWRQFDRPDEHMNGTLAYPLFIKPATEGSSMGIDQSCVVYSEPELRRALRYVIEDMGMPAIAEDFLDGDEYNIGMIGNVIFPALRWNLGDLPGEPKVRDAAVKKFDIDYCNAVDSDAVHRELARYAAIAHDGVGARDYSRSDFRARKNKNIPVFMEINLLPGLDPEKSDLPRAAVLAGAEYGDVVRSVVYSALSRLMKDERYIDTFSGKEIDGFRQSYEALTLLNGDSEPIIVNGRSYHVVSPIGDGI